jgi:hypothetical protein
VLPSNVSNAVAAINEGSNRVCLMERGVSTGSGMARF